MVRRVDQTPEREQNCGSCEVNDIPTATEPMGMGHCFSNLVPEMTHAHVNSILVSLVSPSSKRDQNTI
eukprot:s620_g3.t1